MLPVRSHVKENPRADPPHAYTVPQRAICVSVVAHPMAPGPRASAEAPLDAAATVTLRAGRQDCAAAASGPRHTPCGVRHAGWYQPGAGGLRLAEQHSVCGTSQPHYPPARGRSGATCCHRMPDPSEDGVRQQLALPHCSDNFGMPHIRIRQPLAQPAPANGTGYAKQ
jgi:hypothetical protein